MNNLTPAPKPQFNLTDYLIIGYLRIYGWSDSEALRFNLKKNSTNVSRSVKRLYDLGLITRRQSEYDTYDQERTGQTWRYVFNLTEQELTLTDKMQDAAKLQQATDRIRSNADHQARKERRLYDHDNSPTGPY